MNMKDWFRTAYEKAIRALDISYTLILVLLTVSAFIVVPIWFIYKLASPLFGPDPIGYVSQFAGGLVVFVSIGLAIVLLLILIGKLYEKFPVARIAFKCLAGLLGLLFLIAALSHFFGDSPISCVPNRYIDCP